MRIDFKNCSEEELWLYVGKHLAIHGFEAVLVGGAVVSIYTEGAYESGDLDFIIQNLSKDRLPEVMKKIGFLKKGKNYIHPDCKHLFIEFPPGPLSIGEDSSIKEIEREVHGSRIKILSPTDCIKDRLSSYIYFKARECFDQAILVAKAQKFNKSALRRWCEGEGRVDVFKEFINQLEKLK
ncbi:hypothetical protein [Halobacteriovorax marinus]